MGRRVELVTVPREWGGRDAGKIFKLRERSALDAERWAVRMIAALKGTTGQIRDEIAHLGMQAIAIAMANAFLGSNLDTEKFIDLLNEMMNTCVQIVRDPGVPDPLDAGMPLGTALVSDDDIEEIRTVLWLRSEVLRIHTNFSFTEVLLNWISRMNYLQESSITPTSPLPSDT